MYGPDQNPNELFVSSVTPPLDVGWTVEPADIITPNPGSNGIPGVGGDSQDVIDIDATALSFDTLSNDMLTSDTRKSIPDRDPSIDPITGQTRAIGRSALSLFFDNSFDKAGNNTFSARNDKAGNNTFSARNLGTLRNGYQRYGDSVGRSDTNDYYRLYIDAPAEKLEIDLRRLTSDADVQLLNSSNRVLASSTNSGSQDKYAQYDNLIPGTYYVRVYPWIGDTNYELVLKLVLAKNRWYGGTLAGRGAGRSIRIGHL